MCRRGRRITSYNVCYTKLLRERLFFESPGKEGGVPDHSGSLARFRRIVQDHPGSPYREQAWYGMALCLQEMGKAEESGGAMRALLTAYPKTRFADELHLRLGEDRNNFV